MFFFHFGGGFFVLFFLVFLVCWSCFHFFGVCFCLVWGSFVVFCWVGFFWFGCWCVVFFFSCVVSCIPCELRNISYHAGKIIINNSTYERTSPLLPWVKGRSEKSQTRLIFIETKTSWNCHRTLFNPESFCLQVNLKGIPDAIEGVGK